MSGLNVECDGIYNTVYTGAVGAAGIKGQKGDTGDIGDPV